MKKMDSLGAKPSLAAWRPGSAPVAVVMLALNEAHNMEEVLENLSGWARAVYIVDSYSRDETVDIALRFGATVVQRSFRGFGDQWNFALRSLPSDAPWVMKLDPDERLDDALKASIEDAIRSDQFSSYFCVRRWYFMRRPLPIRENIVRLWRAGTCRFSDVSVNEHPIVEGPTGLLDGELTHLDSPNLDHWFEKQNRYSSAEALSAFLQMAPPLRLTPFGNSLQRRLWLKKLLRQTPLNHHIMFFYYLFVRGTWRAGRVGYISARLWSDVWRQRSYKLLEMKLNGPPPARGIYGPGEPDERVSQFD